MSQSNSPVSESRAPASAVPGAAAEAATALKKGLTITDKAVKFARAKLEKRGTPEAGVRLGVRGAGCSGYSYVIQFDDNPPRTRDYVYEVDGVRFFVDKKSFIFLAGSVLDYEQTLMFQGFKFKNPQEASTCGCGHSFTVRSDARS